jgi:hypothetical protein
MSDDGFMDGYTGAGNNIPIRPSLDSNGVAYCDYSSVSSNPNVKLQNVVVSFEYEAWFTGEIDDVSLAANLFRAESKMLNYLASKSGLDDPNGDCVNLYNAAKQTPPPNLRFLAAARSAQGLIKKDCEYYWLCFISLNPHWDLY